jgi:hypothetical protein
MRKRRFKKRGRSQQSRVYGFLALHTNFQALRKAEVRRMPKRRSSQNSFNTKFAERFFYALREKGHKEGLEQRGFSPSIKQLQRVALILSCTHHACTIGRVGFSAEPFVRIMRYGSITLKFAVENKGLFEHHRPRVARGCVEIRWLHTSVCSAHIRLLSTGSGSLTCFWPAHNARFNLPSFMGETG